MPPRPLSTSHIDPRASRQSFAAAPASAKNRQLSHLHSQLAQLQAALADLEDISRVTAVQAENIKALGGLNGALLMAASKVLGEAGAGEMSGEEQQQR